jgi:hypothetical protein
MMLSSLKIFLVLLGLISSAIGDGPFGIKKDTPDFGEYVHYSSLITYKHFDGGDDIDISDANVLTDGMLVAIAWSAFNEMRELATRNNDPAPPSTMTALAAGKSIYLSSSIRRNGPGFRAMFPDSPVSLILERCVITTAETSVEQQDNQRNGRDHQTGGNCAEPAAAHLYYKTVMQNDRADMPPNSRIATVGPDHYGNVIVLNACGPSDAIGFGRWGCDRFIREINIREITTGTQIVPVPADWKVLTNRVCL